MSALSKSNLVLALANFSKNKALISSKDQVSRNFIQAFIACLASFVHKIGTEFDLGLSYLKSPGTCLQNILRFLCA
jgi:hypothetical protein